MQRTISKAFGFTDSDAAESLKLSEEVYQVLATEDDRECENALVGMLDYDKFDLIKVLLKNRLTVYWCTKLARSASDVETADIEEQMKADPETAQILAQMRATHTSARDRQRRLSKKFGKRRANCEVKWPRCARVMAARPPPVVRCSNSMPWRSRRVRTS